MFDKSKCIESLIELLSNGDISGKELKLYTKLGLEIQVIIPEVKPLQDAEILIFPKKKSS